uniref:Uncharacterized protein n=1 Tax=Neogobius melanostomus TaxID=47308 RepID=A0A8C6UDZ2_9GOBI
MTQLYSFFYQVQSKKQGTVYKYLYLFFIYLSKKCFTCATVSKFESYKSFNVSIVLVDLIVVAFMSATLWLDVHTSHTALCFIMAHFSAAYSALPVPMFFLGILDYYLQWAGSKCFKLVRNAVWILLIWAIAGIYTYATVNSKLEEQERGARYLICETQESQVVTYSVLALTTLVFFVLLPYLPLIPQWVKEADRISEDFAMPRPSMQITVTTLCTVFESGIPAYISVNLLWVQCLNSLLEGTVFWLGSDTVRPYSTLPDNICLCIFLVAGLNT